MSAFIPDQLHHMSSPKLLEFAQIAHKENVKLSKRVKELEKENKRESMELRSRLGSALGRNSEMVEQLAKANERVNNIINGDMMPEDYHKLSGSKFALEQKCVGVSEFVEKFNVEYGGGFGEALEEYSAIYCEQLRKEQEK